MPPPPDASSPSRKLVAAVLPGGEGFGPRAVGAIGLIVHRLSGPTDAFDTVVLTQQEDVPFPDRNVRDARPYPFPSLWARARHAGAVRRALRGVRPDLIEVHNRPSLALALARRRGTAKIVLVLHNDPQDMRRARSAAERSRLLARLDGVVTVSEWVRGRLLAGATGKAPVAVIPNAIDLDTLPPALPMAEREKLILFVGRTVLEKGADLFVRACAEALPLLPGWRAAMIGTRGHKPEHDALGYEAAGPTPEQAGVAMLGYLPHQATLAWMGRAAIVLMPSRWQEPFGLAALEAMAMGAALICSASGGLPEVVGEAAVRIDPNDPAGIARAVMDLAGDPERRAALAAHGRVRAGMFGLGEAEARLAAFRARLLGG